LGEKNDLVHLPNFVCANARNKELHHSVRKVARSIDPTAIAAFNKKKPPF